MDQSRKSSEREKISLQQAQEALELKETAVAEALRATSRENYMLELLTDASPDMAGEFRPLCSPFIYPCVILQFSLYFLIWLGSFLDATAEDQRVDARSEVLLRLAKQNDSDFWANEDRTRRIVRF